MNDSAQTRVCPFCDHPNLPAANYCARCGQQLRLRAEDAQQAQDVNADAKKFLKMLQKCGREWDSQGWPPGAEKTMVARIDEYRKRLAQVSDDVQCPQPQRDESEALSNRCEFALYAIKRKYGADWENYNGFPSNQLPRAWLKRRRSWW